MVSVATFFVIQIVHTCIKVDTYNSAAKTSVATRVCKLLLTFLMVLRDLRNLFTTSEPNRPRTIFLLLPNTIDCNFDDMRGQLDISDSTVRRWRATHKRYTRCLLKMWSRYKGTYANSCRGWTGVGRGILRQRGLWRVSWGIWPGNMCHMHCKETKRLYNFVDRVQSLRGTSKMRTRWPSSFSSFTDVQVCGTASCKMGNWFHLVNTALLLERTREVI